MVVDTVGRALLRSILRLMPPASRRAYADEILELNRHRREEAQGVRSVARLWLRELAAAVAAVWTAWTDGPGPRGRRSHRRVRMVLDAITQDLRFALREIRRGKTISALVVLTLAIGVGAVLTVFSVVDALLLHPIPVAEPERVVRLFQARDADSPFGQTSYPMLADYRRGTLIEGPAGWTTSEAGFRLGEVSDRVSVGLVTGDFFEVLRVNARVGRMLQPADDQVGAPFVTVLSHELWSRMFQRDPGVVGMTLEISGTAFTVVGVAPEAFRGASLDESPELWAPLTSVRTVASSGLYAVANIFETRVLPWISMVGRLRHGVQAAEAETELERIARAVRADLGEDSKLVEGQKIVHLRPLAQAAVLGRREDAVRFVALLSGIVSVTLVIACLNSALLISTRGWSRDLDLSVRQALGAARSRLLRHLLTENLLLALAGAGAGIGLALLAGRALRGFSLPGGTSLARLDMTLDARLAGAALAMALISAAAFGLWPALAQSRRDVGQRLRSVGRGIIQDVAGLGPVIVLQTGLSLVLLVGALLFGRTLVAASNAALGFDSDGVAAISFALQGHGYSDDAVPIALETLVAAVEGSPAVASAAVAIHVPLSPPYGRFQPIPEGAPESWQATAIAFNAVSGGYFRTLGIPIVAGRTFQPEDGPQATRVAILNRAAAAILFPGRDPIGRRVVPLRLMGPVEVIGVVDDHKAHSVADEDVPYLYLPASQNPGAGFAGGTHLIARAHGEATDALSVIRNEVRAFDASLPTFDARLVESQLNLVLMPQRFGALLLGLLATVTLIVSAIGIYATVSFGVRRRTRELGIRMVLGADPERVTFEAVAGTGYAMLAGIVAGLALAAGLARFVESYLYGIDPLDAGSYGVAALVFVVIGLAAAFHPALRAARIGPDRALRQDG